MTTQIDYARGQIRQLQMVKDAELGGTPIDPTAPLARALHWAHRSKLINIKLIDKRTAKLALTDTGRSILEANKETAK